MSDASAVAVVATSHPSVLLTEATADASTPANPVVGAVVGICKIVETPTSLPLLAARGALLLKVVETVAGFRGKVKLGIESDAVEALFEAVALLKNVGTDNTDWEGAMEAEVLLVAVSADEVLEGTVTDGVSNNSISSSEPGNKIVALVYSNIIDLSIY